MNSRMLPYFMGGLVQQLVPYGEGTIIGDFNSRGGNAGLFDNDFVKSLTDANCPNKITSPSSFYGGKQFSSKKTISGVVLYATTNFGGFTQNTGRTCTPYVQGCDDGTSWDTVYTGSPFTATAGVNFSVLTGFTLKSYYYWRAYCTFSPADNLACAQIEFYESV